MRSTPLDFGRHCSGDCSHALHRHLCAVRKTLAGFARILLLTVCIYARRRCRVGEIKVRTKWNATTDWHQCSVRHFARTNDNMMWKLSIFNENCTCGTQPHTYTHTGTSIRHLQASHVKCGVWSNVRCCFSCYKFPLNSPITLTPQSPREGHATSIFFVWPLPKLRPNCSHFLFFAIQWHFYLWPVANTFRTRTTFATRTLFPLTLVHRWTDTGDRSTHRTLVHNFSRASVMCKRILSHNPKSFASSSASHWLSKRAPQFIIILCVAHRSDRRNGVDTSLLPHQTQHLRASARITVLFIFNDQNDWTG